jgi:predicted acylesterase/phospholipase RssA
MNGLILSGGGARGAYQVGVLKVVAEVCQKIQKDNPFEIINGISAGAINAVKLAAYQSSFNQAVNQLDFLWSHIQSEQVFKTDPGSFGKIGLKWLGKLSLGGLVDTGEGQSLLDTSPLRNLILENVEFEHIQKNLQQGHLKALGITAINYASSELITFIQGQESIVPWKKARRRGEKALIQLEHILASCSIPLLFPPEKVGSQYFGDGCLRNQAPCSPAIQMGATKLFIIGVRTQDSAFEKLKSEEQSQKETQQQAQKQSQKQKQQQDQQQTEKLQQVQNLQQTQQQKIQKQSQKQESNQNPHTSSETQDPDSSSGSNLDLDSQNLSLSPPSVALVINTLLNSVLLDSLENDMERIQKVNELVFTIKDKVAQKIGLRELPFYYLAPSEDLGALAIEHSKDMPRIVRHFIRGLGPIQEAGELLSYLLFEKKFCKALIDLGYQDAHKKRSEIEHFFLLP